MQWCQCCAPFPFDLAMTRPRLLSVASVVASALVWGTSFAVSKAALASIPPLWLAWLRFVCATAFLFVWLLLRHEDLRLGRREMFGMVAGGILGYTLNHIFENVGLALSTASDISLMMGIFPVLSLIVEGLVYHRKFSRTELGGIALSVLGVVLIIGPGALLGAARTRRLVGDSLIVLSGVCWAFYSLLVKNLAQSSSPAKTAMFQMLFGSVVLLPLAAAFETPPAAIPTTAAWAVAYLVVLCSVGGYSLYNYGVAGMTSTQAVNILNLIPVFGVLTSWALLHETILPVQVAGGAIVLAGVVLSLHAPSEVPASPS